MFILTMKYKNSQEARRPPPATPTPPALPGTHTSTACLALSFSTCCVFVLLSK